MRKKKQKKNKNKNHKKIKKIKIFQKQQVSKQSFHFQNLENKKKRL
jgi:hypothetical protein